MCSWWYHGIIYRTTEGWFSVIIYSTDEYGTKCLKHQTMAQPSSVWTAVSPLWEDSCDAFQGLHPSKQALKGFYVITLWELLSQAEVKGHTKSTLQMGSTFWPISSCYRRHTCTLQHHKIVLGFSCFCLSFLYWEKKKTTTPTLLSTAVTTIEL